MSFSKSTVSRFHEAKRRTSSISSSSDSGPVPSFLSSIPTKVVQSHIPKAKKPLGLLPKGFTCNPTIKDDRVEILHAPKQVSKPILIDSKPILINCKSKDSPSSPKPRKRTRAAAKAIPLITVEEQLAVQAAPEITVEDQLRNIPLSCSMLCDAALAKRRDILEFLSQAQNGDEGGDNCLPQHIQRFIEEGEAVELLMKQMKQDNDETIHTIIESLHDLRQKQADLLKHEPSEKMEELKLQVELLEIENTDMLHKLEDCEKDYKQQLAAQQEQIGSLELEKEDLSSRMAQGLSESSQLHSELQEKLNLQVQETAVQTESHRQKVKMLESQNTFVAQRFQEAVARGEELEAELLATRTDLEEKEGRNSNLSIKYKECFLDLTEARSQSLVGCKDEDSEMCDDSNEFEEPINMIRNLEITLQLMEEQEMRQQTQRIRNEARIADLEAALNQQQLRKPNYGFF